MPASPYAKILVSVNGGANQSGGIEIPSGCTIDLTPESTVGWLRARWEWYDYPEGWATPSGWTLAASGTIFYEGFAPPQITFPLFAVLWGVWMPRLLVNEQIDDDSNVIANLLDQDATALSMLSPSGLRDCGAREKQHFTSTTTRIKRWLRSYQRNLRVLEAGGVGGGGVEVRPAVVFRPGVASASNHVATWAEVATFIATYGGFCDVYIDDNTAACTVSSSVNCLTHTRFFGWDGKWAQNLLTIASGSTLLNAQLFHSLDVQAAPTTSTPAIQLSSGSTEFRQSTLTNAAGATFPVLLITGGDYLAFEEVSYPDNSVVPAIAVVRATTAGTSNVLVSDIRSVPFAVSATIFSNSVGNTLALTLGDETYLSAAQTACLGTVTIARQASVRALVPSRSTASTRPYTPQIGEQTWDTDWSAVLYWNGAVWADTKPPFAPITTTDATPTYVTLATLAANEVREIDVLVKIAKADGTVRKSFKLSGLFYNNAGTATLDGGSLSDATPRGTGAAVAVLDLSGAAVRLKITGIAATTLVTTFDASVL